MIWPRLAFAALLATTQADSQPLQRIAAADRAFAAAAAEQGWRDAALAYLAPDAIMLDGLDAEPVRPLVGALPLSHLPVVQPDLWQPAFGAMSADGTFGWTIGGAATLNLPIRGLTRQGAYLHAWQRQADGTWRIWLVDDVWFPDVWQAGGTFAALPTPDSGTVGRAGESLADVEAALGTDASAWSGRVAAAVRVHRAGRMPIAGREAALAWAASQPDRRFERPLVTTAGSDDLGIACGRYTIGPAGRGEQGTWIRAWQRDVTGRWRIVFETSRPASAALPDRR